jgi:thiosulfate dehydrogenase
MHRTLVLLIGIWIAATASVAAQTKTAGTSPGSSQLPPWRVPDIAILPDDATGQLVRYGEDLLRHTTALIGPDVRDPAQRYSGNGLECTNCHIDAGTRRFALPLVGISRLYPAFSARIDAEQDLAARINDCMERSMNGRPLPGDSHEMQALLAYLAFLGSEQPAGQAPVGRGAPKLPLPDRAADPQRSATIYQSTCAACHQPDGAGVLLQADDRAIERRRYVYPPLWGPESFNDAAGMARIITGAWFVHANMPQGITFQYPLLAIDDAYDVMAYVDTRPRPRKTGLSKDYPDRWLKPIGAMYPPWFGPFSAQQNRFGPWPAILAWRRTHAPASLKGPPATNDLEQSLHVFRRECLTPFRRPNLTPGRRPNLPIDTI